MQPAGETDSRRYVDLFTLTFDLLATKISEGNILHLVRRSYIGNGMHDNAPQKCTIIMVNGRYSFISHGAFCRLDLLSLDLKTRSRVTCVEWNLLSNNNKTFKDSLFRRYH